MRAVVLVAVLLSGCGILRPGIPDADTGIPGPPRRFERCEVWVKVNDRWACRSWAGVCQDYVPCSP